MSSTGSVIHMDIADLSLYPTSMYKNDEHQDIILSGKRRVTTPKIGESELLVRSKNKAENRQLASYCRGVDHSFDYIAHTLDFEQRKMAHRLDRLTQKRSDMENMSRSMTSLAESAITMRRNSVMSDNGEYRTELLPDIHDRGMVRDRASTMPSKRSRHQSEQLVNHSTSDITLLSPGSSCSSIGSKPASRRGSLQCDPKASRSNTRPEKVVTRSISGTNLFIRELHELRPLSRSRSYSDTFNRETDNNRTNSNKADSNKTDSRFSKVDLKKRYRTTKTQSTEETNVRDLVKSNLPTQKAKLQLTLSVPKIVVSPPTPVSASSRNDKPANTVECSNLLRTPETFKHGNSLSENEKSIVDDEAERKLNESRISDMDTASIKQNPPSKITDRQARAKLELQDKQIQDTGKFRTQEGHSYGRKHLMGANVAMLRQRNIILASGESLSENIDDVFARESPQLDSGDSSKSSLLAIEQTSNIASTLTHPRKLSIPVPTSGSDSDTSPPLSPHISAKHSAALCRSRQLDEQDFSILSLMKSNGLLGKKEFSNTGARKLFCVPKPPKKVDDRPVDISIEDTRRPKPDGIRGLSKTEYRKIVNKALF